MVAECAEKNCWAYYRAFIARANQLQEVGDELGARVFSFLATVAGFRPNYDLKGNPYVSAMQLGPKRTLMPEDLAAEDLEVLRNLKDQIADPEFRARVADIVWESLRDYEAAKVAISSFLNATNQHEPGEMWVPFAERMERALQISTRLGNGGPLQQQCIATLKATIARFEGDFGSGLLCWKLIELLCDYRPPDAPAYLTTAERFARHFAHQREWTKAQSYWALSGRLARQLDDEEEVRRVELEEAECLVSEGNDALSKTPPQYTQAAHHLMRGLEALRRAKADRSRVREVHVLLRDVQRKSLAEMKPLSVDLGDSKFREMLQRSVDSVRKEVLGHTFEEAVTRFALMIKPTNTSALRKRVEEHAASFVFSNMAGTEMLSHDGRVIGYSAPGTTDSIDLLEDRTRKEMLQQATQIDCPTKVQFVIEPARLAILSEHGVRLADLAFLVTNNPFVPSGHEVIYLRGLQSGFLGDWLVAMHLLIPQFEASIRHVFQQHGHVTSTLESEGVQQERDLNYLLRTPVAESLFFEDLLFDLRGLLIERFGHNLRNDFAHGLLPEGGFYQPSAVYFWALVLRMCWHGYALTIPDEDSSWIGPTNGP